MGVDIAKKVIFVIKYRIMYDCFLRMGASTISVAIRLVIDEGFVVEITDDSLIVINSKLETDFVSAVAIVTMINFELA